MKKRVSRRPSLVVQRTADIRRAAWRAIIPWPMRRIELRLDNLPPLDAQRSQTRLRRLHEVMERQSGATVAFIVLLVGLADMVRTWNRSLEHMGLVFAAAVGAGLLARILSKAFMRLLILFELLRLRLKIRKWQMRSGALAPEAAAAPAQTSSASVVDMQPAIPLTGKGALLKGSCACGTVKFTVVSPPTMMGTCHCARCRKLGTSTFVMVRRHAFSIDSGEEAIASFRPGEPHDNAFCFCSRCGTALGDLKSESDSFPVVAHCFDDALAARNGFHRFVGEKPDWYSICDDAKQFAAHPP